MELKISVIVPVFNREALLERTLQSIISQTYAPFELLIIDNGSTDNTRTVAEDFIRKHNAADTILKLLTEPERGACRARQKGLDNAEGDYVLFFDSDDEMHPDLLEKASAILNKNPESDIVSWRVRIHRLDGSEKIPAYIHGKEWESHLIHSLLRTQGYLVKKDFLINAGGWKKNVEVWNDLELGVRLLMKNPKIEVIDSVLVEVYSQKDSITGENFSSKEGKWEKVLEEIENELNNGHIRVSEKNKKIIAYRRTILAAHYSKENNKVKACNLLSFTLKNKTLKDKILLRFVYHYTQLGMRGAWRIINRLY